MGFPENDSRAHNEVKYPSCSIALSGKSGKQARFHAERAKFFVIKNLQKLYLNFKDLISKSHRRSPTQN